MISRAPADDFDGAWQTLLPQIRKGLQHGLGDSTTAEELYNGVKSGDLEMWVIHEGDEVIATLLLRIGQYPAKKTLHVDMMAGRDLKSWVNEAQDLLRKYKELIEADTIEGCSRIGIPRMLKDWKIKAYLTELI